MHRKYYENADECCYHIIQGTKQSMDYGVWVPHFRAEHRIIAYHDFSQKKTLPDVMYNREFDKDRPEPKNGDICPKCGRKIMIIEVEN